MIRPYDLMPISIQNAACTLAGFYRARTRYSHHFYKTLASYERSVNLPIEELYRIQRQQLDQVVDRARRGTVAYRDLAPPSDHADHYEAMRRTLDAIDPLGKESYHDAVNDYVCKAGDRALIRVYTSGTTGSALPVWHTTKRIAENFAVVWRQRRTFGVDIKDSLITVGGQSIVPLKQTKAPYWRKNYYSGQTLFSVYHLAKQFLPAYIDELHENQARYVQGYPSALHVIAATMLDMNRPLPKGKIAAVFTSSESLLATQREMIEKAFNAPVRDHYACTELSMSMTACKEGRLHVDMEFGIVEVEVEEETDEWERGQLLVTALGTPGTMLIRYRIGDVGTRLKKPCECGRPGEVFSEVDGRVEDYVVTPDGRLIGRLDHIFKEQTDIAEAQIVQDSPDAITILIAPRFSYREASQKKLLSQIRDRLGDDLRVDIRLTDSIPREKNGKFRAVKSSIRSHSDV